MQVNDYSHLPEWLTPKEAASHLGIGLSKMYEMVRSGEISSKKFGRLVRIPKAALLHGDSRPVSTQPAKIDRQQVESIVDMVLDILIKKLKGSS